MAGVAGGGSMSRSVLPDGLEDPSYRGYLRLAVHLRAYLPLYVMAIGFVLLATLLPTVSNNGKSAADSNAGTTGAGQQLAADAGGGQTAAGGAAGGPAGGTAAAAGGAPAAAGGTAAPGQAG